MLLHDKDTPCTIYRQPFKPPASWPASLLMIKKASFRAWAYPDGGLVNTALLPSVKLFPSSPTPRRFAGIVYSFRELDGLVVLSIHKV